jgi:hypothetical protein
MSEIKAVLLIPDEGDPFELLKEGPCGARPPMACSDGKRWRSWDDNAWWWPTPPTRVALVLAWNGAVVAEAQPYIERAGVDYTLLAPFVAYALKGMDIGQGPWPGTLVLLDAEGREVTDEK